MLRPLMMATVLALAPIALALATPQGPATLSVRPIPLDPSDPARTRIGSLRHLGGWALSSRDRRFGGISALHVEGGRVVAVSDDGMVFRLPVPGRAASLPLSIQALADREGSGKAGRDSESLAIAGQSAWIGFERSNCIGQYDATLTIALSRHCPEAMAEWPLNGGPEAIAALPGGKLLVLAETGDDAQGTSPGLLFTGGPDAMPLRFRYRPPEGHVPTDAALLPDGRLLVLNRRVSLLDGWTAVLAIVDPRMLTEGAVLAAQPVARLASPLSVDNMEGLAVTQEGGRIIVWLASDDNFAPYQRNMLLKFALDLRPSGKP